MPENHSQKDEQPEDSIFERSLRNASVKSERGKLKGEANYEKRPAAGQVETIKRSCKTAMGSAQ
jgi:hypothetical protein